MHEGGAVERGEAERKGNEKNGNKYLAWAHVEAAHFARRYHAGPAWFCQRKARERNEIVAIKALANKLARASYYMMRDQVPYDEHRLFA